MLLQINIMRPNWNQEFHQTRQFLMENEGTIQEIKW